MKDDGLVLKGNGIYLRLIRTEDRDMYYDVGFKDIDKDAAYYTGSFGTYTKEDIDAHVLRIVDDLTRYDFLIFSTTDCLLGEVVINNIEKESRNAAFRISLFKSGDFNRGTGSEATRLAVDFAFKALGLHRLELDVYSYNPRAIHVYEKCGFIREGIRRDAVFVDSQYHDVIIMGILETDYFGLG